MDSFTITITKREEGKTLRDYLQMMHVGKARIALIASEQSVLYEGKPFNMDQSLVKGQKLVFQLHEKIDVAPIDDILLEILYEDDHLLIVNKPSGLIIHDDGNHTPTLTGALARYYYQKKIFRPIRPIHRLDRDTTGIIVVAKHFLSEAKLLMDMEQHKIKREYLGIALHRFKELEGQIDLPMGRDRHQAGKQRVSKTGQRACTHYQVEKLGKKESLVRFRLDTGRTHQIRVHMAAINHPLLGDELYGEKSSVFSRTALHSAHLEMFHPITGEFMSIDCSLPLDMLNYLQERKMSL